MSPGSVQQTLASGEPRRILYYTSQKAINQGYKNCAIKSINAKHMDDLVRGLVLDHLKRAHGANLASLEPAERDQRRRELIERVVVAPEALTIKFSTDKVAALAPMSPSKAKQPASATAAIPSGPFTPTVTADGVETLSLPIAIKRHDDRRILVNPGGRDLSVCTKACEFEWVGFERAVLARNTREDRQNQKRQTPVGESAFEAVWWCGSG